MVLIFFVIKTLANSGELCGLLPGNEPTSDQLHRVVELSSGIMDDQELFSSVGASPVAKLKEALTSKKAFQKYYLVTNLGRT